MQRTIKIRAFLLCVVYLSSVSTFGQTRPVRQVVLVSIDGHVKDLDIQQRWLRSDPAGLKERDITVSVIMREQDPSAFRKLKPSGVFTFILIGKDGGEKYRSRDPVTLKTLYAIIDAMPMRQDEMRRPKQ